MDLHDLVAKLKQLASELQRTPTKIEYTSRTGISRYAIEQAGGYTVIVQAAGLKPYREKKEHIGGDVFETSLSRHLEAYKPPESVSKIVSPTFAVISDIHWPFENQTVIKRFIEYIADIKPEYVFINGDAADMYSHAKFPRSHNVFTPRDEQTLTREKNENFWRQVKAVHPKAHCVQMLGNHDVRPMKRILEAYPEAEDWIAQKLKELFTFDSVETVFDTRQEYRLGDCLIFHGYRTKLGDHRDHTLYNCANGHSHVGGVVYRRVRGQTLWELNSGLAGDPEAKGLTYTPQRITNWTPGFGARDVIGPRFIAL